MKHLLIIFFITPLLVQYQEESPLDILNRLQGFLNNLGNSILGGIETLFYNLFNIFANGIAQNTGQIMQSSLTVNLNPMEPLMSKAYEFTNNITFAIAQLSFILSLGMYVSFVSETLSARGKNNLYSSAFAVVLIALAPSIVQFFSTLSKQLSQSVLNSISGQDISGITANILLSLVTPAGFFFLILDSLALLLVATIVVVAVILGALAPLLFLLGITTYSLPFQAAKSISNRLFTQAVFFWLLPAIGFSIIVIDIMILGSIVSPLTPLVVLVLDYLILRISFSIASDIGATYPVIDIMNRATSTVIMLGAIYLSKGRRIPVATGRRKGSKKEQEVD